MADYVRHARSKRRQALRGQSIRVQIALALIKLLLILPQTARVVALECEAGASAGGWNLKLVDDLLPEFVGCDTLKAASQDGSLEEFAQIELFATDLGHLEVLNTEVFLELNQLVLEFAALSLFIFSIEELQLFGQSYVCLVVHHLFIYLLNL